VNSVSGAAILLLMLGPWSSPQAPQPSPPTPPAAAARPLAHGEEQALRARVLEWWKARERRDHQRMYELFEPSYRKQVTFADFVKENAVRTRYDLADARVESVLPETPALVHVKVDVEARPPGLPVGRVTADDVWVRVAGKWFKRHQDSPLPFTVVR